MDEVLGHRPASQPSIIFDISAAVATQSYIYDREEEERTEGESDNENGNNIVT